MNSDASSQWDSPSRSHTDTVRRQVVEAAAELMRGTSSDGRERHASNFTAAPSDQSAMALYLALLQDRLPVYARTMEDLRGRAGKGAVEENLVPVAQATLQFYSEILAAKLSVFTKPDQLLELRRVLKSRDLGPHAVHTALNDYLDREQCLGRVVPDADCSAVARLFLGACVNYAFTTMILGEPPEPRDEFVTAIIDGLRLTP